MFFLPPVLGGRNLFGLKKVEMPVQRVKEKILALPSGGKHGSKSVVKEVEEQKTYRREENKLD